MTTKYDRQAQEIKAAPYVSVENCPSLTDRERILQIKKRERMIAACVGSLYPRILAGGNRRN